MDPRVLPWQSWDEWNQVREALFGNVMSVKIAAQSRVDGWRVRGRIPHAIDATAQLFEVASSDPGNGWVDIQERDALGILQKSEQLLRNNYSMVIVRSLNGIVDSGQQVFLSLSF